MGLVKGIQDSYRIAIKDLLEFERNRIGLIFLFLMPFFMLIMTGYIFPTENAYKDIPVALVDLDNSQASQQLIGQLQAMNEKTNMMEFKDAASLENAKTLITRGQAYGAIVIPQGFSDSLSQGKQANITVLSDNSIPQVSMVMQGIGSQAISMLGAQRAAMEVQMLSVKANQTVNPAAVIAPYKADIQGTVPGDLTYFDFIAPGLLMMIVMMGAMTGIPRAISHEKEIGTFDGILAAPVSEMSIIMGKTIAQTVRGFVQGIIVLIIAILVFGVTIQGNILLAFALLFLGIFSFIGLGILLTSMADNEETAMIFMTVLQFPMMFLTGVFFPIQQMPWFMQGLSKLLPLTYAVSAMRKVMILNAGLVDVLPEVAILLVFGAIMLAIAIPVFRKSMTP
ncbi:ABC-type multidrug transport system, permease component [Methanocella conradii HZ254]|uniref:ABC-type multidrug transport system, permease component n=1 Tax=Methanocella conradii (strain DSM 24694 / JCM 17849 / CGMCC 1.5162 / HZ254) TaxID=1041930 RepID=H8I7C1_METCZ|nr:ABC transporter permease [Methanocella conradii]AFD00787.1 ABC-type multidrug transport system, permease component [Methanocella conradii HZ254]